MADQQPGGSQVDFQAALQQFFAEQFAQMNDAEAQATGVNAENQKKIQASIDETLAQALMGSRRNRPAGGAVQFPEHVFELAVALTQQPQLQAPVFAFYKALQQSINQEVSDVLKRFSELAGDVIGEQPDGEQPPGDQPAG